MRNITILINLSYFALFLYNNSWLFFVADLFIFKFVFTSNIKQSDIANRLRVLRYCLEQKFYLQNFFVFWLTVSLSLLRIGVYRTFFIMLVDLLKYFCSVTKVLTFYKHDVLLDIWNDGMKCSNINSIQPYHSNKFIKHFDMFLIVLILQFILSMVYVLIPTHPLKILWINEKA